VLASTGYEPGLITRPLVCPQPIKDPLLASTPHTLLLMSSNINLSRIGILANQTNYASWALEVEATARLGGFWKAYLGSNTTTSTTPDAAEKDRVDQ